MLGVFVATRFDDNGTMICGVFANWNSVLKNFELVIYDFYPGVWAWEVIASDQEYKLSCPKYQFHYKVYLWSITY